MSPSDLEIRALLENRASWFAGDGGGEIDFTGFVFSNRDLQACFFMGAPLRNLDFRHSKLCWSNFVGADCFMANFIGADLRGANFAGADLRIADFRGAILHGANFSGTICDAAKFDNTSIQHANFQEASTLNTEWIRVRKKKKKK